jgi:hypothetical protein
MLERVRELPAVTLDAQGYLDDFWRHADQVSGGFWKLERRQTFREPEEPSWLAMTAGDWDRALALAEERRTASKRRVTLRDGRSNRRIRIVEQPVIPYLQWEMQFLRIWVETGAQDIRVVDASAVRHLETHRLLPEIVTLGNSDLYEVLYDETGTHSGGRRIDDTDVIAVCHQEMTELYDKGEDLLSYFDREIAPLPPPNAST